MRIKAAVDCREFRRGVITGIGRFLLNFIGQVPKLRPDWELLLLGGPDTELPFVPSGSVSYVQLSCGNPQLWEQFHLPMALRGGGCGIFFSPYYKTCAFSGVPSLITVHDMLDLIYPDYTRFPRLYRELMRFYARRSSAVITDSENSRRDIVSMLGLPPRKVLVNPVGVDRSVFFPAADPRPSLRRLGIEPGYLLYVGNSNPHKNVDGLVRAYASLDSAARSGRKLVLAGVGPYSLPAGVDPSSFVLIPTVPQADLPSLYSAARAFVFPSFYEGFGLPPLEAMACGCPVASSNAASLPEVLGDACLYFDPRSGDGMRSALGRLLDGGELAGLRAKGLVRAAEQDASLAAAGLVSIIERFAAPAGGR